MSKISSIKNDVQDKNSTAWIKLCDYIDQLAENGGDTFSPLDSLGPELFSQIFTLPESISKLKKVKKMWLYGSKLKRIPPEIGQMDSLEYFDPYTSYDLHWFPYEIMHCNKLKDSRISTRALYGNITNRMGFPRLKNNPVHYDQNNLKCSICRKETTYKYTNQMWISLKVATDVMPLLVNSCSKACSERLPTPARNYIQKAHKGGSGQNQPPTRYELMEQKYLAKVSNSKVEDNQNITKTVKPTKPKRFKLIRKLWDKDT